MEELKHKLESLIAEGEKFTFDSFSEKSRRGVTVSLTPAWVTWQSKVKKALEFWFIDDSSARNNLERALNVKLIGYGSKRFDKAKAFYLHALRDGWDIIENEQEDLILVQNLQSDQPEYATQTSKVKGINEGPSVLIITPFQATGKEGVHLLRSLGINALEVVANEDFTETLITQITSFPTIKLAIFITSSTDFESLNVLKLIYSLGYLRGKLSFENILLLHETGCELPEVLKNISTQSYTESILEVQLTIMNWLRDHRIMFHPKQALLTAVHELLNQSYNREELTELAFTLGIDVENLQGDILSTQLLSLLKHMVRRQALPEFIEQVQSSRSRIDFADIFIQTE